jgi:hypothetical protein
VNLHASSQAEELKGNKENRHRRLLDRFLAVVRRLAPGLRMESVNVDESYQVWARLPDGVIPIESVSQGTTALLGWVGVLLQRLYELYDDPNDPSGDPTTRHAVVLIDEIDAHMHPGWQQGLVPRLQREFPRVQFIVTTHSPFVVAGMPVERLARLKRNRDGEVERVWADADMTLGRADQILTGDLFGLKTTLDEKTQEMMQRYRELLAKPLSSRTAEENEEFVHLGHEIEERIPPTGETPLLRRAQELVKDIADGTYPPELKSKAQQLARAIYGESEYS